MEQLDIAPANLVGWCRPMLLVQAPPGCSGRFCRQIRPQKIALVFYSGLCWAPFFVPWRPITHYLLVARIVTEGLFGGVIGSVSFAIITDLFKLEVRGRVMGFVQMSFAASQVLGLPIGLVLAMNSDGTRHSG